MMLMAKSFQSHRSNLQKDRRNPAEPLRHPRHEAFAKTYVWTLNGMSAAIEAGYAASNAARTAGRLLSSKAMAARIQHLQTGEAEALTITRLVQELHYKPRAAMAKAITSNPFTGETQFDLGRLTPEEIASLEFTMSFGTGLTGRVAGLKLHSNTGKGIAALAGIVRDPDYAQARKHTATTAELLVELAKRNASAAPIRSGVED
jgi:hypothetical protein